MLLYMQSLHTELRAQEHLAYPCACLAVMCSCYEAAKSPRLACGD